VGLSAHEMILVLRARDEASRILRGFSNNLADVDRQTAMQANRQMAAGAALATTGVAIAAAGIGTLQAFNAATNAAMDYAEQVALTATQVDGAGVSMEQLNKMGKNLAREMPVDFKQIQGALYDIFSSIETDGKGAEEVLRGIGRAAIGGKVDMESAGRGILQILNAWKLQTSDTGHVNDVMFQLVRKGVGTYEEFTKTMGRSIPSALRASQSLEDLSGMMAFLTRNGLSTAMASTTAARAMDAMSNPKTIEHFRDFGIEVLDTEGKIRPMSEVMVDLKTKMEGMTDAAKSAQLKELFKGSGGTIQAMRFFSLAVNDSNGMLQQMTDYMHNAGGAADEAYALMANTPQARIQALSNAYDVMKVEIGEQLLPVKLALAEAILKVINAFMSLSPETRKMIVAGIAIAAVLAVVIGVVMAVVGTLMMFAAAATIVGIGLGPLIAIIAGVVAGIAVLAGVAYLVYKNWDLIKAGAVEAWTTIMNYISPVINVVKDVAAHIMEFFNEVWQYLGPLFKDLWNTLVDGAKSIWDKIQGPLMSLYASVMSLFHNLGAIATNFGGWFKNIFDLIKPILYAIVGVIGTVITIAKGALAPFLDMLGNVFANLINVFSGVIDFLTAVFTGNWSAAWDAIKKIVVNVFEAIWNLIKGAAQTIWAILWGFIEGIINFFIHLWDVLVGHSIVPDMITSIITWFAGLPIKVLLFIANLVIQAIAWFANFSDKAVQTVGNMINNILNWFGGLPGKVIGAIAGLAGMLFSKAAEWGSSIYNALSGLSLSDIGSNLIQSLGNGMSKMVQWITDKAKSIGSSIIDAVTGVFKVASPSKVFTYIGEMNGKGLAEGMVNMIGAVTNAGTLMAQAAIQPANTALSTMSDSAASANPMTTGGNKFEMNVYTQEIDPVKHAADLGWLISTSVRA